MSDTADGAVARSATDPDLCAGCNTAPREHRPCGATWAADYGALPCDRGAGHSGPHRCYGSRGPIEWALVADSVADKLTRETKTTITLYCALVALVVAWAILVPL